MPHYIHQLLQVPVFSDEEKSRRARLLHWIIVGTTLFNIIDLVLLAIFAPETISTFWLNGVYFIFLALVFGLMKKGYLDTASYILILSGWAMLTGYMATSGGVTSPTFDFLSMVIIVGAILLGSTGAAVFGMLTIASAVGLYWAGQNDWIAISEDVINPGRAFGSQTAVFFGLAVLMWTNGRLIQRNLTRALEGERILAERNHQLQDQIAQRELIQQEQTRLAQILETTSDIVGIADLQGHTLYLNRAGRRIIFGMDDPDNPTAKNVSDYHPASVAEMILQVAIPTALEKDVWEGETTVLTADHSEIPVSQVIIAHRNTGGQVEWVSTIIRDISERKQAEMERLELALQRERVEFFREFLGNISHDLRTPLSVIRANLYLIEQFTDPQRQRDKLQTIKTQTILLEKYLQDILTISRLEHAPKLELKSLDVNDLIKSIHNQLQSKAEEKHLVTQLDLAPDVDLVQGDKDELQRAIVNLVENALRYTPGNGCVTIRTYKGENNAVVEISDTGIGISPEDLPHIFDRFYRATPARSMERGGTGLGLAIVKKVVDMHNGVIEVNSIPQKGSTFRVTLPLNRELFAQ